MTKERMAEYEAIVAKAEACDMEEDYFFDELADAGFTIKEFEGTPFYEMIADYTETHAWEK